VGQYISLSPGSLRDDGGNRVATRRGGGWGPCAAPGNQRIPLLGPIR